MIGTHIAHYEITGKLGEGGMGEVYRAADTKLGREVALKVLPEAFTQDEQRMGRFSREAQVLASLNHPNIAAIYGLEEKCDRPALVMELVEGPTLQERIARGALTVEQTARVGLEIAQAIEAAHDKGIVHRDLKPANVKITPEGHVKVLDFGLAKALDEEDEHFDFGSSPTLTAAATQEGVILGTAAYMSPEQATGARADRRSDIWSYGVLLSEMLQGQQPFAGESASHVLAAVLKDEPDWGRLPKNVPPRIVDLLKRCLQKDAKKRLQAIGEARVLWEEYLADPEAFQASVEVAAADVEPVPTWKRYLPWAAAAALAIGFGVLTMQWSSYANHPRTLVRSTIMAPADHDWALNGLNPGRPTLSSDGRQIAFVAVHGEDSSGSLWVRPLDSPVGRPIQSTDGATYPFWSSDGTYLAFFAEGKLKKVPISGGPPVSLCDASNGKGGSWSQEGVIVYTPTSDSGLFQVSAAGGECVEITRLNSEVGDISHRHPFFLPDNQHFLYLARRTVAGDNNLIRIGSLDGQTDLDLLPAQSSAAYASGRLLFVSEGTLMAQPFDLGRLELTGEAVPLIGRVLEITGAAVGVFDVSQTGELIYLTGRSQQHSQLTWMDRSGLQIGTLGEAIDQDSIILAPGSTWAATQITDDNDLKDIWLYEVNRGVLSRFTFAPNEDFCAVWSPTGDRVAFASDRGMGSIDLFVKEVGRTGEAQEVLSNEFPKIPYSWTSDGTMLLFTEWSKSEGSVIRGVPVGDHQKPITLDDSQFGKNHPVVSPNGRWLAYSSNESGTREVYVTTFPNSGRRWRVSVDGGLYPQWTKNGAEIIFQSGDFRFLLAAEVNSDGDTFEVGEVIELFEVDLRTDEGTQNFDVSADGERFLLNTAPTNSRISPLHLVTNWPAILEDQ